MTVCVGLTDMGYRYGGSTLWCVILLLFTGGVGGGGGGVLALIRYKGV